MESQRKTRRVGSFSMTPAVAPSLPLSPSMSFLPQTIRKPTKKMTFSGFKPSTASTPIDAHALLSPSLLAIISSLPPLLPYESTVIILLLTPSSLQSSRNILSTRRCSFFTCSAYTNTHYPGILDNLYSRAVSTLFFDLL
jgi:hypothetical protein